MEGLSINCSQYDFKIQTIFPQSDDLSLIAEQWQTLASQSAHSNFFLSWHWISVWLIQQPKVYCLTVELHGELQACGFFVEHTQYLFGLIPIKQLYLHKTGNLQQDQMWIEYNDFLLMDGKQLELRHVIFDYLSKQNYLNWDELHIDMAANETAVSNCAQISLDFAGLEYRETFTDIGYCKNLNPEVPDHDICLDLSKNSRQQIKRSLKILSEQGQVSIIKADTPELVQQYWSDIQHLHIEQWGATEWGSGFENPPFIKFHQALINNPNIDLIALCIDKQPIAFSYNFCLEGKVYFYLSAMTKDRDNRVKIGLILHALAMQYYQKLGFSSYDFLAGKARYKRSLSDNEYQLTSSCIYKNTWWLRLLNSLRRLKNN